MLFGYPPSANAHNCLHWCLCYMILTVNRDVKAGRAPRTWKTLVPESFRAALVKRHGLRTRFEHYRDAFKALSPSEMSEVEACLKDQNRRRDLYSGTRRCRRSSDLPESIRPSISSIFLFGFRLLSELGVRDRQYRIIYDYITDKVCPFCGLAKLDKPGAVREDADHYLYAHEYPFAAANLWNLVPMCGKCNSDYKHEADMIWDGMTPRVAVNPFDHTAVSVSLSRSTPFAGTRWLLPRWQIDFSPALPSVEAWASVFQIRVRYGALLLDLEYESWISQFAAWCSGHPPLPIDAADLVAKLRGYIAFLRVEGLRNEAFLKRAVAEYHMQQCASGNAALVRVLIASAAGT